MNIEDFRPIRQNGDLPDYTKVDLSNVVTDLWNAYVDSSMGLLNDLEAAAMKLEAGEDAQENAGFIRRLLHSLKGEAGMTGMMDVHNLCHEAESAFDELNEQGSGADMVLRVKDWIVDCINYAEGIDFESYKAQLNSDSGQDDAGDESESRKIRTLCIDDNPVCSKRLKMLLEDFCECTFAENGAQGLEMYVDSLEKGRKYQFITLDIQMPEMDGHETLRAIRAEEEKRGIMGLDGVKVIMLTSQDTSDHIFSAFREGCEAYVLKNYMGDKLLEEMTKLKLLKAKTLYSVQ